jgi:glycosyltransferase involved in cell wall biosynthesis
MRIGIDIRHLAQPHPTGVGVYTIETIHALAAEYPETTFILFACATPRALQYLPEFTEPNILVEAHTLPSKILKTLLFLPLGVTMEDILYRDIDAWWLPNVEIFKTRLPYFLTVHDLTMEILGRTYSWKRRVKYWFTQPHRLIGRAQKVFCVSKSTAKDVKDLISKDISCVVTPLGVNEIPQRRQPYDGNILHKFHIRQPYFLSLCTLEPRKNLSSVIEGFLEWKKETGSNTQLVLAGISGWKNRSLRKLTEGSNDIILTGYLSEKEKATLLRNCEGLIFPSFYEGFGLPVLEALQLQKPVITAANSSLVEFNHPGVIFIDAFRPSDITAALHILPTLKSAHWPSNDVTWQKTVKKMRF